MHKNEDTLIKPASKEPEIIRWLNAINATAVVNLIAYGLQSQEAKIKYIIDKVGCTEQEVRDAAVNYGYTTYAKNN